MNCPKCKSQMTIGAPHSEGATCQHECNRYGIIIPVSSATREGEEIGYKTGWYKKPTDYTRNL